MASRDDRLPAATRSYVIFGLLFVVAVALALHSWLSPQHSRGQPDSWLRLLILSDADSDWSSVLSDRDGVVAVQLSPLAVIEDGRAILGGEAHDHTPLAAALAYADQHGYGFVAFAREDTEAADITPDPPPAEVDPNDAPFFVYSVGDVASEGPRVHWGATADFVDFEAPVRELDSLRRALFEHPDMAALWIEERGASGHQARQILDSRKVRERAEHLAADHQRWQALRDAWPQDLPGALAGPWEQVRAAPIRGGVLIERRGLHLTVDAYRRLRLELDDRGELWFVAAQAIRDGADLQAARRRCEGLPASVTGDVVVAPDGQALILRPTPDAPAQILAFAAGPADACRATLVGSLPLLRDLGLGRPNAGGRMAWNHDDDWLHWWDQAGAHREQVFSIDAFSGPWWIDDGALAMIGERPRPDREQGNDRVLTLIAVGPAPADAAGAPGEDRPADGSMDPLDDRPPRVDLDLAALLSPEDPRADLALLDLRPAGADTLLLLTERCPDAAEDDARPCLLRLRTGEPLHAWIRAHAQSAAQGQAQAEQATPATIEDPPTLTVLGPLGPLRDPLAAAADGSRLAWIGADDRQLYTAVIREPIPAPAGAPEAGDQPSLGPAQRVDDDPLPESAPRIAADGSLIVSAASIDLAARIGDRLAPHSETTITVARVFVTP